jgi:hypothetical protein
MPIVIEPAMTVVMRTGKEEKIMVVILDIHQAIPANEIKLFAVVYPGLPMPCQFVDLLRLYASMSRQGSNNLFDARGSECRSPTSTAHFLQTFV